MISHIVYELVTSRGAKLVCDTLEYAKELLKKLEPNSVYVSTFVLGDCKYDMYEVMGSGVYGSDKDMCYINYVNVLKKD